MNQAKPKIFLRETLSICDRRHLAPPLEDALEAAGSAMSAPPQECSPSGDCLMRGLVNGPASPRGWPRLWRGLYRAHLLPPFHRVDPRGTSASAPCLLTDCSCFPENPPPTEPGGELTYPLGVTAPTVLTLCKTWQTLGSFGVGGGNGGMLSSHFQADRM